MGCGASQPSEAFKTVSNTADKVSDAAEKASDKIVQAAEKVTEAAHLVSKAADAAASIVEEVLKPLEPRASKLEAVPMQLVEAHIWAGDPIAGTLIYPELGDGDHSIPHIKAKENFAICLSGGGLRAATLSLGWLRAFKDLGYVQRARYLCSNSGSSWVNSPFSFQKQVKADVFLGPYLRPEECNLDALADHKPGSYGLVAADAEPIIKYVKDEILGNGLTADHEIAAWSDAMASAFLKPFGLAGYRTTITCARTAGAVHQDVTRQASSLGCTVYTALTDTSMPYPIMTGSIILRDDPQVFFPFEFTPLYGGCAGVYPSTHPIALGGGFVEPLGLNSKSIAAAPPAGVAYSKVQVTSDGIVPLADMMGISSGFIAQKLRPNSTLGGTTSADALGLSVLQYWSPLAASSGGGAALLPFGDGGGTDNMALLPALRRKVAKVIVCAALGKAIGTDINAFAEDSFDISRYFGRYSGSGPANGIQPEQLNTLFKVFDSSAFDDLFNGLNANISSVGLPFFRATCNVLENKEMGVQGGWTVEVLWITNCQLPSWEGQLPDDTKERLAKDRNSKVGEVAQKLSPLAAIGLGEFPYVNTYCMNYDPELVSMMSQQSSWVVQSLKQEIDHLLAA